MADKKIPVLSIESLTVDFDLGKTCHAVRDTSVRIEPGEMVAPGGGIRLRQNHDGFVRHWPAAQGRQNPPRGRFCLTALSCGD